MRRVSWVGLLMCVPYAGLIVQCQWLAHDPLINDKRQLFWRNLPFLRRVVFATSFGLDHLLLEWLPSVVACAWFLAQAFAVLYLFGCGEILKLTPTHPPLVPPWRTAQAVGLLDPVATGDMNLRDTRLPPSVVSGLQITARDERRDLFPVKDIIDPRRTPDGRLLNLVNPGAHSDIGGSYRLDGLSVRNGNLLTDYVNTLSDTPFLKPRTVPTAPEMNVIHHSEQHQSFYTTTAATALGQRAHVKDLAGTTVSVNRTDAQALDTGLHAQFPLRPVALSPDRTDPAVPTFALHNGAPEVPSWQQQMQQLQYERERSHAPQQWQVPMKPDAEKAADKLPSLHDDPEAFLDRMLAAGQYGDRAQYGQERRRTIDDDRDRRNDIQFPAPGAELPNREEGQARENPQAFTTGDPDLDKLAAALFADDEAAISRACVHIAQSPQVQSFEQLGRDLLAAQQREELQQQEMARQQSPQMRM